MGRRSREKQAQRAERSIWTPFVGAHIPDSLYPKERGETIWKNSLYTVFFHCVPARNDAGEEAELLHLSIKRNDRQPIRDWRHLQRIKNELVGAEEEMVEIFPAESRLVDSSNQFHLFGIRGMPISWGFHERLVAEAGETGAQQRPFPEDARPADLQTVTEEAVQATNAKVRKLRGDKR